MVVYCHVNVRRDLTSANTDSICRFGRSCCDCINKIEFFIGAGHIVDA